MRILHYSLGFPPSRTGGLTYYTIDLIQEQINQKNNVFYLYPGRYNWLTKSPRIKRDFKHSQNGLNTYELINSLPLPLFGGIKNPKDFMCSAPHNMYVEFLNKINPTHIHVHTLMGIHKDFFVAAKSLKIPIFYTTHDYFGLAPEPNFFFNGESYNHENSPEKWMEISNNAMSTFKLRLFQSKFYPLLRKIVSKLKRKDNTSISSTDPQKNHTISSSDLLQFEALKNYYSSIFSHIDFFIFNSSLAKSVFQKNLPFPIQGEILHVTNAKIQPISSYKKTVSDKLRIAYIGPDKIFKGFFDFISLAVSMNASKYEFHTYGYNPIAINKNIIQHGKYQYNELASIYQNIDVLVVPSKWNETFGLIVLEALSHQTPVFVSNHVGAKDLLDHQYIFSSIEELKQKIQIVEASSMPILTNFDTIQVHISKLNQLYLHKI